MGVKKSTFNPLFAVLLQKYCKNFTSANFEKLSKANKNLAKGVLLNLSEITGPIMTSQRALIQKL